MDSAVLAKKVHFGTPTAHIFAGVYACMHSWLYFCATVCRQEGKPVNLPFTALGLTLGECPFSMSDWSCSTGYSYRAEEWGN